MYGDAARIAVVKCYCSGETGFRGDISETLRNPLRQDIEKLIQLQEAHLKQQKVVDAAGHQRLQMMKQTLDATMNTKQVEAGYDGKSPEVNGENIIIEERMQLQCA